MTEPRTVPMLRAEDPLPSPFGVSLSNPECGNPPLDPSIAAPFDEARLSDRRRSDRLIPPRIHP